MELTTVIVFMLVLAWIARAADQRQRIALLGAALGKHQIEKHMERLTQGYLRALGEDEPQRREQIWSLLQPTEQALCNEFGRFVQDFAQTPAHDARVSRLPLWLPLAHKLPGASFDVREALAIHGRGIRRAIDADASVDGKERAFTILAELLLMQHTCHWYCRSKMVASARMLGKHQTSYDQAVAAVLPATRADYQALVGGG